MSRSDFALVSPGLRRRADGVELRKMRAPDIRALFRGRFSLTVPWWIAFDANGLPVRHRVGNRITGGPTLADAIDSLDRHERKVAA